MVQNPQNKISLILINIYHVSSMKLNVSKNLNVCISIVTLGYFLILVFNLIGFNLDVECLNISFEKVIESLLQYYPNI